MRKIIYLLPLAVLLVAAFLFSSQPRDQQTIIPFLTRHFPFEMLSSWLPDVQIQYGDVYIAAKSNPYHFIEFMFRKSAHIFLYSLIGLALYCAFFILPRKWNHPVFRWIGMLASTLVIASLDEWNQSRVPMRAGQSMDVWLDVIGGTIGATLVILLIRIFAWMRRERRDIRISPFRNRKPQG